LLAAVAAVQARIRANVQNRETNGILACHALQLDVIRIRIQFRHDDPWLTKTMKYCGDYSKTARAMQRPFGISAPFCYNTLC
jgi:hypothetical protein